MPRHREEVLNVELAHLLGAQGVVATPEQIEHARGSRGRRLPDVTVVDHQGLRTTIEGKYEGPGAAEAVLGQASERVEEGIAQIALAVLYPLELRSVAFADLPAVMRAATLRVAIATEAEISEWVDGGVDEVAGLLRRGVADLLREDVVADATAILETGVEAFAAALLGSQGAAERVADVLSGEV